MPANLATAKEISVDWMAAVAAVLSNLDGRWFTSRKKKQRKALKAFLGGQRVFVLLATGFGKSLVQLCSPSQLATGH